jgi:hypothetical protein
MRKSQAAELQRVEEMIHLLSVSQVSARQTRSCEKVSNNELFLPARSTLDEVLSKTVLARMNPERIHDFALAQGLLAKTDALDALSLFGCVCNLRCRLAQKQNNWN